MSVADVVYRAKVSSADEIPSIVKSAIREVYSLTRKVDGMSPGSTISASAYSDAVSLSSLLKRLAVKADPKTRQTIGTAVNALAQVQVRVLQLATPPSRDETETKAISKQYATYVEHVKRNPRGSVGGV